ncbi:Alpha/Beta hydrolase protein [Lanmaoa asiatica]|nr:Alpha/Beta hydrolase protein [Lanmaoa asiatica]
MPIPHIPQDLLEGVSVVVQTNYGSLRGGRTTNGAAVFLEVPYASPPVRFQDPQSLPVGYRYEDKHYVIETKHCYQPDNNGQAASVSYKSRCISTFDMYSVDFPPEHLKGFGVPSEDPLFLNIAAPSSFTGTSKFPVKVYLHGGFLQFGSPHDLNSQAQYVSQERSEVWVNIGYRLSVLGFLACDKPKVDGNFGFKDQWLGLLWVRDNIAAFGGKRQVAPWDRRIFSGHSVHQILHHISRLPAGKNSPIRSARLESNAIMIAPKTAAEFRPQFEALCCSLGHDPKSPNILDILRDPRRVSPEALMHVIETDAVGVYNGTFRGCLDGSWMATDPDPMTWQRNGHFGRKLREKGVKSVVIGNVSEEWYLCSIAHPINSPADIVPNLLRYYPQPIVEALISMYPTLHDTATPEELQRLFGDILSDGQVQIPARLLARDLRLVDFPVLRYEIRWTPEQLRPKGRCFFSWVTFRLKWWAFVAGYVTHATDRCLWTVRIPSLNLPQKEKALEWLDVIDREVEILESGGNSGRPLELALTLKEDQSIAWSEDTRWEQFITTAGVLPGERSI